MAVLGFITLVRTKPTVAPQIILESAATKVTRSAKSKAKEVAIQPTAEHSREAPSTTAREETQSAVAEPIEWGSDPFVRDWVLSSEVANLNLRAITISSNGASALINDQIVQVGDEISGKKVIQIESDKVTLEQGGRTFTLTLGE